MHAFWRAWVAEWRHLLRHPSDLGLLTLYPLVVLTIVAAMLLGAVPRKLPVAVLDQDGSAFSQRLVDGLNASPTLRVLGVSASSSEVDQWLRRGQVYAALQIPPAAAQGVARHAQPVLTVYYNASFLSMGKLAESAIRGVVQAVAVDDLRRHELNAVLPRARGSLPTVQVSVLFNPQMSFEWFLQALIHPAVLHLLVAIAAVMAIGRELRQGSLRTWARHQSSVPLALLGKLAPAVLLTSAWAAAWLIWIAGVRGWRPQGSLALIWLGQFTLFAATAGMSALLVSATRRVGTALSLSAVYAGSALAYSGGTLPLTGASLLARGWSAALPFTHYLPLQMDQFLGAPRGLALRALAILAAYALLTLALSCALLTHQRRTPRRREEEELQTAEEERATA